MNYGTILVLRIDYYNFTAPHKTTIFRSINPVNLTIRDAQRRFRELGYKQTCGRSPGYGENDNMLYWRFSKNNHSACIWTNDPKQTNLDQYAKLV